MVKLLALREMKLCTDRGVGAEEAKLLGSVAVRHTVQISLDEVDVLVWAIHHVKSSVKAEREKHVETAKLEVLVSSRENWIEKVHKKASMRVLAKACLKESMALVRTLEQLAQASWGMEAES